MNKLTRQISIAALCSLVVLVAAYQTAFGQAGSTGGTLGKTDKSASGGEEPVQTQQRNQRKLESRASDEKLNRRCQNIIGTWFKWYIPINNTTFKKDGSVTQTALAETGQWTCSDGTVIVKWSNGNIDRVTVSDDSHSVSVNGGTFSASR